MADKKIFAVKDYSKECAPFEFKLPGTKKPYSIKPFSLLSADDVAEMTIAERNNDLNSIIATMTKNAALRKELGKLPILALRDLMEAWKNAAGITSGE